jgi:predicted aspartyl protease
MHTSHLRGAGRGRPLTRLLLVVGVGILSAQASEFRDGVDTFLRLGYEPIALRRTSENHLFLFGRVNDRRRSCLVDTGWSFTTMQADKDLPASRLAILKLGRTTFTNQPARAEKVFFNGQRASFDVVLGLDFLRRNFAVLDCGSRRLFTRRAGLSDEAQRDFNDTLRRAGFRGIELRLKTPPALTLVARVNGEPVELLLDSGAVWSCVDERQCARLKLKPMPSTARITGAGATGLRSVAVADVKSMQLGEVDLQDANVALFDLADWGFAAPEKSLSEVQGILGGDLLAVTSAVIDCHRLKLWLKPAARK